MAERQHAPAWVAAGRGAAWLGEGFALFKQAPGAWIGIVVVWLALMVAVSFAPGGWLLYTLFSPVLLGGVLAGARAQAAGRELQFTQLFRCFGDSHFGPLVLLGLLVLCAQFVIMLAMFLCALPTVIGLARAAGTMHADALSDAQGLQALLTHADVHPLSLAFAVLVGLVLYLVLAMAMWFAPALVALADQPPTAALRRSLAGCWRNMGAFTVYGLIGLLLVVVAMIPFGLGMLVVGPLLLGSVYAGYRDIYGDDPAGEATQSLDLPPE